MTLANVLGHPILWPPLNVTSGAPSFASLLTDAVDEKAAAIVRAPKTGAIRYVHFLPGTIGSGDPQIDVRIETVDQATNPAPPTGTLFGTTTNCLYNILSTDDNVWQRKQLTADCSVTIGDALAVVIHNKDGGTVNIQRSSAALNPRFPYIGLYTTSWTMTGQPPVLALEYSDGTFANLPGCWGMSALSNSSSTSSTLHRGIKITIPFKCRVSGWWSLSERATASGTVTTKLFGTDGTTVLLSKAVDTDLHFSNAVNLEIHPFDSTTVLAAGSTYWLAQVQDGTTSNKMYYATYNSQSGLYAAMAPGGGACVWSQATSPAGTGDWADTALQLPWMGLLIDQLDDGAGSGGGVIVPTALVGAEGVLI